MNILFRYAGFPMGMGFEHWQGHGGKWGWWCIYDILRKAGHKITLLDWRKQAVGGPYDAVISIQHLSGLEDVIRDDTILLMRLTMMDPFKHNQSVRERVELVNQRRSASLEMRRIQNIDQAHYQSIERADRVFLNGNDYIKRTYPERYWDKIITTTNAAGNINERVEMRTEIPQKREWLWHAGSGAIHKGLDLCLEVFAKHPEWTLHVTGNLSDEPDFLREFSRELSLPNIHYHGWVHVESPQFKAIIDDCVGFILPTCSEGQSPAVATCLTLGLYPIISRQSGIDLPAGYGIYLEELNHSWIEESVDYVMGLDDSEILATVEVLQSDAVVRYNRNTFRERMAELLREALHE